MTTHSRWTLSQVTELFEKPLLDLLFEAQQIHRQHFDPRQVQVSTLLSIKTGACPEDCKYCPQSSRYKTGLEAERLMEVEQVLESARQAKNAGSTRFCMGSSRKRFCSTSSCRLRLVAAMTRTSTVMGESEPTRCTSPCCRARSSLAWTSSAGLLP